MCFASFALALLPLAFSQESGPEGVPPLSPEQAADRAAWEALDDQVVGAIGMRDVPRRAGSFVVVIGADGSYHLDDEDHVECQTYNGRYLRQRTWRGEELFSDPTGARSHSRLFALLTGRWIERFEPATEEAPARTTLLRGLGAAELDFHLFFGDDGRLARAECVDGSEVYHFEDWGESGGIWLPASVDIESERAPHDMGSLTFENYMPMTPPNDPFDVSPRRPFNVEGPSGAKEWLSTPKSGWNWTLPVRVGEREVTFTIDSGIETTLIDASLVADLETEETGTKEWVASNFGRISQPVVRVPELGIGAMVWSDVQVVAAPLTVGGAGEVRGVLGMDFLLRSIVHVDGERLRVLPYDRTPDVVTADRDSWWPLSVLYDAGLPLLETRFGAGGAARRGRFLFDTTEGLNVTLLPWASEAYLDPDVRAAAEVDANGRRTLRIDWLEFGYAKLGLPGARLEPAGTVDDAFEVFEPRWCGSLGADLFEHFELVLDFSHGTLFVRPLPAFLDEAGGR